MKRFVLLQEEIITWRKNENTLTTFKNFLQNNMVWFICLLVGWLVCWFVCLFVCLGACRPTRKIFTHLHGDVPITGEGLRILTHAWHSWPVSSEKSLTCHIYCDTGQPFIMVISEDTWHSPVAERLAVELSLPVLSRPGIEPQSPACEANYLPLRNRGGQNHTVKFNQTWQKVFLGKEDLCIYK